ncbi:MAG: hypothetical protein J6K39_04060 [Clostridia bacterium]|nr:hypothetical protein [Clostridia bacterium]
MLKVEKIETERLLLSQFKMTAFDDFVEYRDDPNLYTYLMSERKTMEEYKAALEDTVKSYELEILP